MGRVLLADLLAGHSTTGTIARVGAQAGTRGRTARMILVTGGPASSALMSWLRFAARGETGRRSRPFR
jgi:hypothetical protein